MVIRLKRGADLHMAQLMPLPPTVSCSSKIQIGFTFLVPAHPGSPGKRAVKQVCVCQIDRSIDRWIDRSVDRQTNLYSAYKFKRLTKRLTLKVGELNSSELDWSSRTAALQPINFVTLTRVANDASCNWVDLVPVSSVQFSLPIRYDRIRDASLTCAQKMT